ncbi:MAG: tRNA (adenosine(37)-N6)-threonylcarbamoyltransferase complex dimerization subunit type 1 TsaB [Alphaproteobacteria bacterium]|nr:tRNA (adenosine(37)-N6)-threonylcarbamoyltransferase complex dimerization subunit type 1 TsaB [Alphaproteobacteria bacterium]
MYTLVFDTTAGGTGIGLYKDSQAVYKSEKIMEFGQAEALACGVAEACQTAGIAFNEIGFLGVCSGPGSFTGVRAGLAFARGLCLGNPKLEATGVSAFEVYAGMLKEQDRAFYNTVVIETKREDFYFQLFDKDLNKLSAPLALSREEIAEKLKGHQVSFIGDGVERLLSVSMGLQIKQVELSEMMSVDALYQAALRKYFIKSLDFPKPLYIREADACVK